MPAAYKPKITEKQYTAAEKKYFADRQKHGHASLELRRKIEGDTLKKIPIQEWFNNREKHIKKHPLYPKLKKHEDAAKATEKEFNKSYTAYTGNKRGKPSTKEYHDVRSSLAARMQILAGDKPALSRKYHKTMMRFHRREGNHHLNIENSMMANANKCRNKPGDYTAEGEGYKSCAEDHAKMVQRHANKYQSHKNAMRAIPEGRKKGSK